MITLHYACRKQSPSLASLKIPSFWIHQKSTENHVVHKRVWAFQIINFNKMFFFLLSPSQSLSSCLLVSVSFLILLGRQKSMVVGNFIYPSNIHFKYCVSCRQYTCFTLANNKWMFKYGNVLCVSHTTNIYVCVCLI